VFEVDVLSGSDRSVIVEHESCIPTPPASPARGSKNKTSFSQKISRVNTLFRGPFDGSSNNRNKQKGRYSLKSQQSFETLGTIETGSVLVLSPDSSRTATTASSFNSTSTSVTSPASTGKTSLDSRFAETDPNSWGENKQSNSGTVITRRNAGPHKRSSPEGDLAPIEETAPDYSNVTILTVERAAAAKIHLETYFNILLSPTPSPREMRRRKFEIELHRRMHDENFTPEQQDRMRYDWVRRESEHLREGRVSKARSIRARLASREDTAARLDDEYEVLKILGKGSFGVVRLVRERSRPELPHYVPKQVYAMKVIRKSDMLRTSQEGHLRAERDFLVASKGSDWYVTSVLCQG
jgi:hypothetical protein